MSNTVTWVEQAALSSRESRRRRHLEGNPGEDRAGYQEDGAEQVEEQREVLH